MCDLRSLLRLAAGGPLCECWRARFLAPHACQMISERAAGYAGTVDLGSVKAAPTPVLLRGAIAAAMNAQDLLYDAEVLAEAGSAARAYSLATLAVEEAGKAGSLVLLAMMPGDLRAQAPVGRMLEWHQLKQVQGLLIAAVPYR